MAGATINDLNSLYGSLLGRAPDQSGIRTYTGMDPNKVRQSILNSTEYQNRLQQQNNSVTDFAAQSKAQMDAMLARQNQEQQGLFDQYKTTIGSQEKLPDMYTRLSNDLGIPDAQRAVQGYKDQIYRVKDLIDRLNEDIGSRTQGTLTTQAMRDRMVASEGGNLNTQLSRLGTGMAPLVDLLTGAQGTLGTMMPLYMQQQEKDLKPLELQINSIGDRFAREISGFTSSKETTLAALMDKLDRDRSLQDREWQLAQQLAAEARQFAQQKALAANYMTSTAQQYTTPTTSAIRQLPSLNSLSVVGSSPQYTISLPQLQGSSASLQGSSPYLQGNTLSLQGSGIRLQ